MTSSRSVTAHPLGLGSAVSHPSPPVVAGSIVDSARASEYEMMVRGRHTLLLALVLLAGCGTSVPSTLSPSPSPSVAPTSSFAPPLASSVGELDRGVCEVAIPAADHMLSVLIQAGEAIGTPEMRDLVDETVEIAEASLRVVETSEHPILRQWAVILTDIDESRLDHLTGDDVPFIEAVGAGAAYADVLKAACSQ